MDNFVAHHVFQANIGAKKRELKKPYLLFLQFLVLWVGIKVTSKQQFS